MGSCVADTVFDIVIRQIIIVPDISKGKLENPHSRKPIVVAERLYSRSDNAKVLGDDWQRTLKGFKNMVKKSQFPVPFSTDR